METAARVPTLWNRLAENMHLKDSPTAEVTLSEHASFTFARVKSSEGLPEIARPIAGERGYLVAVQLKAIPFIEQFFGTKKVSSGSYPVGAVSAIDLREEPAVLLPNPFDALVLHVTQAALDEIAHANRAPRVDELVWPLGQADPMVYHLGCTLNATLERPHHTSKFFIDHVLHALNSYFVHSYGGVRVSALPFRGGLSSLQMRTATELLEAHLDGKIALRQVAEACELSVSHFARAFKQTFGMPPYRWLIELRVKRARGLMMDSRVPLADIAIQSGFADQSALSRSFKRIHGVTPGTWRRSTAGSRIGSGSSRGEDDLYRELRA